MKLETERLILKEINESHVDDILRIRSNDFINKFVDRISPQSNYEALDFILTIKRKAENRETVYLGISYKDQPTVIGTICLWNFSEDGKTAEVGYELLPEYHRQGIMSEALNSVLNYGFDELNLQEILAFTHRDNESSKALLLKYGFIWEEDKKDEEVPANLVFSLKK
ncbi:GNAT family N-acetyltransferase [Chryseobacterium sp. CT-SW4]|uniref:GNAT family N-acetyltransferase n=1 Tax=Chryseobacterium sp. SW-1 TaxID=3157343 RepID=UPI003B02D180